ncbi:MAG: hypothetical protein RLZZ350_1212 [Verrucomicrobiota bacterium]|jgi:uncharacterized protein (DUF983 family)
MKSKFPIPKLKTLLWRGCRKQCPQCGEGAIYEGWLKLRRDCAACGLRFLANEGDLWGTLLFVDRVLFIVPLIVLIYFRVWHPDFALFIGFGALVLAVTIFTMPHRNGISLALDYLVRRNSGDLVDDEVLDGAVK